MTYHDRMMNIPATLPNDMPDSMGEYLPTAIACRYGHRDARHAAAEIANEADATIAGLLEACEGALTQINCLDYPMNDGATPAIIEQLRAAIAKAKGESA